MNDLLEQFVREALARGMSREEIRTSLRSARWRVEEIDAALAAWAESVSGLPVPRRRISLSAREAFQHLVLFATLFIFTYDVGALLFTLIERGIVDAARPLTSWGDPQAQLRWSTAGVITALPIFLWTHHILERSLSADPEKRTSGIRRWLTYLTLFVAALVLIGDFTTVVRNALAGELTSRFVLKAVVVFGIAGVVFGHFLTSLRLDEAEGDANPRRPSRLGQFGIAAAVLATVAGVVVAGWPHHARQQELDALRVRALQEIEDQVRDYYRETKALPMSVAQAVRPGHQLDMIADPVTRVPFGYSVMDSVTFTLSADFDSGSSDPSGSPGTGLEWRHRSGHVTFTRRVAIGDGRTPVR